MSRRYQISLTEEQKKELLSIRDHAALPYMRMKASGILKVWEGNQLKQVASQLLLRRTKPETVKKWCERFLDEGADGLRVQAGRGRKPAFFP
jgi:hypothetical protein